MGPIIYHTTSMTPLYVILASTIFQRYFMDGNTPHCVRVDATVIKSVRELLSMGMLCVFHAN